MSRNTADFTQPSIADRCRWARARGPLLLFLALAALVLVGCSPDLRDGAGPLLPLPNVEGTVVRSGAAASGLEVELRIAESAEVVASTETSRGGEYSFTEVPAGDWEVKVSSDAAGDFDAVSRVFHLEVDGEPLSLSTIDISSYGSEMLEPVPGARATVPDLFQWLNFRWVLPDLKVQYARVQVYDTKGEAVWFSSRQPVSEVSWNGVGNEGEFEGRPVSPGMYVWRVKVGFPDGSEARLDSRELHLE